MTQLRGSNCLTQQRGWEKIINSWSQDWIRPLLTTIRCFMNRVFILPRVTITRIQRNRWATIDNSYIIAIWLLEVPRNQLEKKNMTLWWFRHTHQLVIKRELLGLLGQYRRKNLWRSKEATQMAAMGSRKTHYLIRYTARAKLLNLLKAGNQIWTLIIKMQLITMD